jgi:hypothetical protein
MRLSRPKGLVGRQRSHTDDRCFLPRCLTPTTQRDWDAVDANTSASLIGGGRRMRHVHARKGTVFLRFVQVGACLALLRGAGNKERYQWLGVRCD